MASKHGAKYCDHCGNSGNLVPALWKDQTGFYHEDCHRKKYKKKEDSVANAELTFRVSGDQERTISVKSRDFFLPQLKQIGSSIDDIIVHFAERAPHKIPNDLEEIRTRITININNYLSQNSDQWTSDLSEYFIFLDKSLAVHIGDGVHLQPASHVCDMFIILPQHPTVILTIAKEDTPEIQQYCMSLARELRTAINRFMDDNYNPLFGTFAIDEIGHPESFNKRFGIIVQRSSKYVTKDSLSMSKTKYSNVLKSFWMSVAQLQSGALDRGKERCIHFLTLEQCIVLVENISSNKVNVKTKSKSGGTTLTREVTKRLQRLGPTQLLKTDAQMPCLGAMQIEKAEILPNTKHLVTDRFIAETTISKIPGNVWKFTTEFIPTKLLAMKITNIKKQQVLMLVGPSGEGKSVLLQMILDYFQDEGTIVLPLKDIDKLNECEETIVFADDIFGKHSYAFHLTVQLEKFLEKLDTKTNVKFVCTSRDDLYKSALSQLGKFKNNFQEVYQSDLAGKEEGERIIMLQKYIQEEHLTLTDSIMSEIVKSTKTKAFPLACHLFAKTQPDTDAVEFFENPLHHIKTTIGKHLKDDPVKVLLYTLVSSEGTFAVGKLSCAGSDELEKFKDIKVHLNMDENVSETEFIAAAEKLTPGLLKKTEGEIAFHHPSIFEITAYTIAEKDLDFIVQSAPLVFFTHSDQRYMITIPRKRFNTVAKRLSEKMKNGDISSYRSILLQDEKFVEEICGQLSTHLHGNRDGRCRAEMMYWAASSMPSCLICKLITNFADDDKSVQSAIKGCCRWGNASALVSILEKGRETSIDINQIKENSLPCLIIAANQNHCSVVEALLDHGADVNITERRTGGTALHWAAAAGHSSVVDILLKFGISIDQDNVGGATALFISASNGHKDVVEKLLAKDADIHKQIESRMLSLEKPANEESAEVQHRQYSDKGFTPLHAAVSGKHETIVRCLLTHKANPCIESSSGSPIAVAAKANLLDIFHILTSDPRSDLESSLSAAYEYGRIRMLEILLSNCNEENPIKTTLSGNKDDITNILQKHPTSFTALHFASFAGNINVVQLLLREGIDVNCATKQKFTAIHGAATNGHSSIVNHLAKAGAKLDVFTESRSSPLHFASINGHADVVQVLLQHGARINVEGHRQWTPLHWACNENKLEVVKVLTENKANQEALTDNFGTPLLFAAYEGHLDIIDFMLENQAELNPDGKVFPPLLGAAIANNRKSVRHLLKRGARVNHVSAMGVAAIHGAILMGSLNVVKELILAEANVNVRLFDDVRKEDKEAVFCHILTWGKTTPGRNIHLETYDCGSPLHIAADLGYEDIIEELVTAGAKLDIKNSSGKTPLAVAQENDHLTIVDFLKQHR